MQNGQRMPAYIIVLLIFFWPVGLFLLYRYLTADKTNMRRNSKTLLGYGIGFAAFGVMAAIFSPTATFETGESGFWPVLCIGIVAMIIGGIFFYQYGRYTRLMKRCGQYSTIITRNKIFSLGDIAAAAKVSLPMLKTDLQKMIDMKILDGAYIDDIQGKIVLPGYAEEEERVVRCKSCGALNRVKYPHAACEYCGAALL